MDKTLAERLRDCAQGVRLGADGMGWSPDHALLEEAADKIVSLHAELQHARDGLTKGRTRMREDNERLAREAYTWSKAAEAYAADAERFRWLAEHTVATGLARWVHPFQFLGEAVDARRNLHRPLTPVGWSDTDWLAHLERLQQNEAAYAKGPLPERGWD